MLLQQCVDACTTRATEYVLTIADGVVSAYLAAMRADGGCTKDVCALASHVADDRCRCIRQSSTQQRRDYMTFVILSKYELCFHEILRETYVELCCLFSEAL